MRLHSTKVPQIAAENLRVAQYLSPQSKSPVTRPFFLSLQQFEVCVVTPLGEEPLAVTHFETTLHPKPFAIGVRFQHEQRRERGDDVELFREPDDLVTHRLALTLSQEQIEMRPRPET